MMEPRYKNRQRRGSRLATGLWLLLFIVPITLLVVSATLSHTTAVYHQVRHIVETRQWPQQLAVVSQSQAQPRGINRRGHNYVPVVLMSYRLSGVDYRDVPLDVGINKIPYAVSQQDGDNFIQRFYPVGRQMQVLIDPQHPAAPSSTDYLHRSLPWAALFKVGFLWVLSALLGLIWVILFLVLIRQWRGPMLAVGGI
jgi:hypothetical protein